MGNSLPPSSGRKQKCINPLDYIKTDEYLNEWIFNSKIVCIQEKKKSDLGHINR